MTKERKEAESLMERRVVIGDDGTPSWFRPKVAAVAHKGGYEIAADRIAASIERVEEAENAVKQLEDKVAAEESLKEQTKATLLAKLDAVEASLMDEPGVEKLKSEIKNVEIEVDWRRCKEPYALIDSF